MSGPCHSLALGVPLPQCEASTNFTFRSPCSLQIFGICVLCWPQFVVGFDWLNMQSRIDHVIFCEHMRDKDVDPWLPTIAAYAHRRCAAEAGREKIPWHFGALIFSKSRQTHPHLELCCPCNWIEARPAAPPLCQAAKHLFMLHAFEGMETKEGEGH